MSAPKICEHGVWEMDTAALADGLCPLCTKAELDRLRAENDALWNIADAVRFIKDRVPSWINDEIDELHRRRNAMRMVAPAQPGKEE